MSEKFLMGNEAIALGAIHAGVNVVAGYPGTPSTEILETVAKLGNGEVYVEWSVNEKAGMEVAAGAAYAGARTMVTMKQVGLNVASDPLMSLAYVGVKGGMVVVSADDPGPISSQTEQDTRNFAQFSKLPVFDPSSPQEAYQMIQDAFEYSEKYQTPVLFRPTTRVCHGCANVIIKDEYDKHIPEGFVKDTKKWVIFPRLSYQNHLKIVKRNDELSDVFSDYEKNGSNQATKDGKRGIVTGGISFAYTMEALENMGVQAPVFKVSTPYPFPYKAMVSFLDGLDEVMVIEELDPVLEKELYFLCTREHINITIKGKLSHDVNSAGENTVESVRKVLSGFLKCGSETEKTIEIEDAPALPVRPPVLCAGCPHRASFYAVKQAMKGKEAVFCGDIGCYTLGNAMPLDMVDTCLCMGADVTMAQGLHRVEPNKTHFSFIGDSTFFASGITGVVNAVYNQTDLVLIVLDNSTTAMTGHQPHPGTGKTMMGQVVDKVSIEKILMALGLTFVTVANPLDLGAAVDAVKTAVDFSGVRAVIFKSPCIAVSKPSIPYYVRQDKCIGCEKCIKELGCPAIVNTNGKVSIEPSLCVGCSVCSQVCPKGAIEKQR